MEFQQNHDFNLKSNLKEIIKKHCLFLGISMLYLIGDFSCPFYKFTGLICPTCGVSRAMLSLFQLNIDMYIKYHPLAFFLVIAVLLLIHIQYLPHKRVIRIYSISILFVNLAVYIIKIIK